MVPKELKDQGRVGLVTAPEVAPEPDGEWRPRARRMTIQQFLVEGDVVGSGRRMRRRQCR